MSEFKKYDIQVTRYIDYLGTVRYRNNCLWDGHVTVYRNSLSQMLHYAQGCYKLRDGEPYRPIVKLVNILSNNNKTYKIIKTPIKYKIKE